MKNEKLKIKNCGFTLIEIIVATSIFTVVMLITIGSLLSLNDSSRKAQALRTVIDNLNFAVEDMNRKVRTGDYYHCYAEAKGVVSDKDMLVSRIDTDCVGNGGQAISLSTQETEEFEGVKRNVWVAYIFRPGENGKPGVIVQRRSLPAPVPNLALEESAITSPEVDIKRMKFRVVGSQDPKKQPMVIIDISGVVDLKKDKLRSDFSLQTAISRRGTE